MNKRDKGGVVAVECGALPRDGRVEPEGMGAARAQRSRAHAAASRLTTLSARVGFLLNPLTGSGRAQVEEAESLIAEAAQALNTLAREAAAAHALLALAEERGEPAPWVASAAAEQDEARRQHYAAQEGAA